MALRLLAACIAANALALLAGRSDRPTTSSDTGTTATSTASPQETASTATGATDTGALPDPACDSLGTTPEDATSPCGLAQVFFDAAEYTLDARAECQVLAAAPCFAQSGAFVLYAHASAGEVATKEQAILLTDRRGQRAKEFLQERGVDERRHDPRWTKATRWSDAVEGVEASRFPFEITWMRLGPSSAPASITPPTRAASTTTRTPSPGAAPSSPGTTTTTATRGSAT